MMSTTQDTLNFIYKSNDKTYDMMNIFDTLFTDGQFGIAQELIDNVDFSLLDTSAVRGICTCANWAENKLNTENLYKRAYDRMREFYDEPKCRRLLWFTLGLNKRGDAC